MLKHRDCNLNSCVGDLKLAVHSQTTTKARFWKTVSHHRTSVIGSPSTVIRHKAVLFHQQGLSQTKRSKKNEGSGCAVQEEAQQWAMLNIVDAMVEQDSLVDEIYKILVSLQNQNTSSKPSAQNWWKVVRSRKVSLYRESGRIGFQCKIRVCG